ncbi:unnamed protein product [Orchesella dallaii]|uniref:Uncharacterized protein n=1 Tax=Orchesella dallaii TaxID=48710 RepID=A0ABP1QHM5_9HEXA
MIMFRVLLPIIGALLGSTHSYSYTYPGAPVYTTEVAASYPSYPQAYSSAYPQQYGNVYGTYSGSPYGCATTSVLEILDSFFCHYAYSKRYSSTAYPVLDVIIEELTLVTKCAPLESVKQKVLDAITVLKGLQDATYVSYGQSSLAGSTYAPASYGYNYNYTATSKPCDAASKMAADLKVYEDRRRGFVEQNGFTTKEKASAQAAQAKATAANSVQKTKRSAPELPKANRFTRGLDKADYTCALIPSSASCTSVNHASLLTNILLRIQQTIQILLSALGDLKEFILGVTCDDDTTKYPLLVAADTFGSTLTAADILLDTFNFICKVYEGTASSNYGYPAGSTSTPVVSTPSYYRAKSPSKAPSYGYGYSNNPGQQYRIGRAVSFKPAAPLFFLVGR